MAFEQAPKRAKPQERLVDRKGKVRVRVWYGSMAVDSNGRALQSTNIAKNFTVLDTKVSEVAEAIEQALFEE
jgi:hypothetical protein